MFLGIIWFIFRSKSSEACRPILIDVISFKTGAENLPKDVLKVCMASGVAEVHHIPS